MLGKILLIIIFAAALVFFCWMLVNYWLRSRSHSTGKEPGKLKFSSKTAFAMTDFWNAVDEAKDIPKEVIKEEMENVPVKGEDNTVRQFMKSEKGKENIPVTSKKRYRIKENM